MKTSVSTPQVPILMRALRGQLKLQGLRQQDIADRLGVGIATVRRYLRGSAVTMARFEQLCTLANITLPELVAASSDELQKKQSLLTPSQERALAADDPLCFLFFTVLHGWPPEDCRRELQLSAEGLERLLKRLVRLGLIDMPAAGKIRLLTTRTVAWRPGGPLARQFDERVKHSFLDLNYGAPDLHYMSDIAKLSAAGRAQLEELMDNVRREIHAIVEADRRLAAQQRTWQGILMVFRPVDLTHLREAAAQEEGG